MRSKILVEIDWGNGQRTSRWQNTSGHWGELEGFVHGKMLRSSHVLWSPGNDDLNIVPAIHGGYAVLAAAQCSSD